MANFSGASFWLTAPHQISSVTGGSSTTNLSFAERPVWMPVRTISAPSSDRVPSLRCMARAVSALAVRLL